MPAGALALLILRVLRSGPLHGYAIAQRIHQLSADALRVEEGSLYPALQKILRQGWARAAWGVSDTSRRVRFYTITKEGLQALEDEIAGFERQTRAIRMVLRRA
jgi:transcriptional regulator